MKSETAKAWRDAAYDAWMRIHYPEGRPFAVSQRDRLEATRVFFSRFGALEARLSYDGEDWPATFMGRLRDRAYATSSDAPSEGDAAFMKCARYGLATASGRLDWLLPSERDGAGARAEGEIPEPGAPSFEARFRFRFRGRRPGAGRTVSCHASSVGSVRVVRASSADAPVVLVLSGAGRAPLELREYREALFRPVLAPGAWAPLGEAGFAGACSGVDAWRDDPFAQVPAGEALAIDEMAERHDDPYPREAPDREAALAECLERAGPLLSIDGVVHRRTRGPTFHPVLVGGETRAARTGTTWRLPGLSMTDAQEGFADRSTTARVDLSCGRRYGDAPFAAFPVSHAGLARSVAEGAAAALGIPFSEAECARVENFGYRDTPDLVACLGDVVAELGRRAREAETLPAPRTLGHLAWTKEWLSSPFRAAADECARIAEADGVVAAVTRPPPSVDAEVRPLVGRAASETAGFQDAFVAATIRSFRAAVASLDRDDEDALGLVALSS